LASGPRQQILHQADHLDPDRPHIIFSISKSVTGLLAGIHIDRGSLSPAN
jgi:CubicO group peptidase (beta-lactamase class C family)